MIEHSYISDKKISKSMTRLNNLSQDKKFRLKSLRMKTQQKNSKDLSHQNTSISPIKSTSKQRLNFPTLMTKSNQKSKQRDLSTSSIKKYASSAKNLDHLASINSQLQLSTLLIDKKLRIKSSLLQKNYQQQLSQRLSIPKQFLQQLYALKMYQESLKMTSQKYVHFCKTLYLRLIEKVQISISSFNFKNKVLEKFLEFFITWKQNKNIIGLDLSLCSQLAYQNKTKEQQDDELLKNQNQKNEQSILLWPKKSLLSRIVLQDQTLMKIAVRNMHISPQQMIEFLTCCLNSGFQLNILDYPRDFEFENKDLMKTSSKDIDISNKTSQTINRLGGQYYYLEAFFTKNEYVGIMRMENLNITDDCIQKITNGINKNLANNPLKILTLSDNFLTSKSLSSIYSIMKSGITELNLSNNPLGIAFFMEIKNLRANTVKNLDLTQTGMNSQSLIHFLQQLAENKNLQVLKLDKNDFSHHWFNKIKEIFESGLGVQSLSMVDCGIKNFDVMFEGLIHGKSLKKLNVNYNLVNIQDQNIQKIVDCLKMNKCLKQIKIRFCGYNQPILIRLIEALKNNLSLQTIDISQNHLSDNGGKNIIKLLNTNTKISNIGIEKLQFTVKMSQQIEKLLSHNKSIRQKEEFFNLIHQNQVYKSKDTCTWKDLQILDEQGKKFQRIIKQLKIKTSKIESRIQTKKQSVMQLRRSLKQEQKKRDRQLKHMQQDNNRRFKKIQHKIDQVEHMEHAATQSLQIENNLIKALQAKIQKQNERIKRRQNELQDELRDHQYMQRKKQKNSARGKGSKDDLTNQNNSKIKQKQKQLADKNKVFDNTKGIVSQSKRKSVTKTAVTGSSNIGKK